MTTSLSDVRAAVDVELHEFLARADRHLHRISDDAPAMGDVLDPLIFRGKRIRAALCIWGYQLARAATPDAPPSSMPELPAGLVKAATSLELLHVSALIHDDMMDRSDTRRGQPTVHRRFEALHADGRFIGDAAGFGSAGALLTGDLCLSWSMSMFAGCGLARAANADVLAVLDRMRTEVMVGQYLDILGESRPVDDDAAVAAARRVVQYKSAKYSVEHPLLLGASLAGADEELLQTVSAYGLPLGEAFQLRDDVLGVFGDPGETGKPAGDDLREGKRTVLIAYTRAGAAPAERATIDRLLGRQDLGEHDVDYLRRLIERSGGLARTEQLVENLTDTARSALNRLPESAADVTAVLESFTHVLTVRSS